MLNRLLTLREVAAYLQIDANTIYRWCRDDRIPAIKIGKEWRIDQRDLDHLTASRSNNSDAKPLAAILPHQLSAPEHILVMTTDPEKVFELEVAFFRAAHARGYPMLKACWWQHPDDVRRRLTDAGLPVEQLEGQGRFVIWDLWPVYRRSGVDGIFALWQEQSEAWDGKVFWGSGSHLVDEWSEDWSAFLEYEEQLHSLLLRLPGVLICPCVATPAVAEGAQELINLVPHHTGVLFLPDREAVGVDWQPRTAAPAANSGVESANPKDGTLHDDVRPPTLGGPEEHEELSGHLANLTVEVDADGTAILPARPSRRAGGTRTGKAVTVSTDHVTLAGETLAVPARYRVTIDDPRWPVCHLDVTVESGLLRCTALRCRRRAGDPPLTGAVLAAIPIGFFLKKSAAAAANPSA